MADNARPTDDNSHHHASAHFQDEVSVLEVGNLLLRHRRLIVSVQLVFFVLTVAVVLLSPRRYSAVVSFVPNASEGAASRAAGLAAQFGLSVPGTSLGLSPEFYVDLLRSREILSMVADTEFELVKPTGSLFSRDTTIVRGGLVEILDVNGDDEARNRERVIRALSDVVGVTTGRLSGVVSIRVSTRWPSLSRDIAARMLDLLNDFNITRRQSRAAAEEAFTAARLEDARGELRQAENTLQLFLQRNRSFSSSPQLVFEHDRLQRDVAMRQQIVTSLLQAYEQARIDAVRDTPVITVIQDPELPVLADPRRLALKGLIALLLGGILGVIAAVGREIMASSRRADSETYGEFQRLRSQAVADLRRLGTVFRRRASK